MTYNANILQRINYFSISTIYLFTTTMYLQVWSYMYVPDDFNIDFTFIK